ncbi:hypothetical protein AW15_08395 [Aeromonas sp. HZM]|nr:hypothetical protein AW15_08395 [Aeromonas sp. HZM]
MYLMLAFKVAAFLSMFKQTFLILAKFSALSSARFLQASSPNVVSGDQFIDSTNQCKRVAFINTLAFKFFELM